MAAGQGSGGAWPSNDDFTFLSLAVVMLGLAFFGWLGWTNYHAAIAGVVADVARWQIGLVHHFSHSLDGLDRTIATADLDSVTLAEILSALDLIGRSLRIPAVTFILLLASFCFTRAASSRHTRALDLDGLIAEQAQFFGPVAAFARRNLRLVALRPDTLRPSDPALHAREWVARFAHPADGSSSGASNGFDEVAASRALTAQLGPVWRGVEGAPGHVRVLYAAFALHLEQRRTEARALLGGFARALPPGESRDTAGPAAAYAMPAGVVAGAEAVLRATELREQADIIAAGHAYATPALMSLLTAARSRSGVLAPAQFACLKLVDRSLWYALHSLGFEGDGPGQTTHPNPRVEAAGARDHWAAERLAGRPLIVPSLDRAMDAVRAAIGQDDDPISKFPEAP